MHTLTHLIHILADYACVPEESIVFTEPLAAIGLDSLDLVPLMLEIEDHFRIDIPVTRPVQATTTVAELHDLIQALQQP